jgi:hypothetical protein
MGTRFKEVFNAAKNIALNAERGFRTEVPNPRRWWRSGEAPDR